MMKEIHQDATHGDEKAKILLDSARHWKKQNRWRRAMREYDLIIQEWKGPKQTLSEIYEEAAGLYRTQGNTKVAFTYLKKSLELQLDLSEGKPDENVVNTLLKLGGLSESVVKLKQAESYYQRAYTLTISLLGPDHEDSLFVFAQLDRVQNRTREKK